MRTDDLIALLASDRLAEPPPSQGLPLRLALAVAVAAAGMVAVLGLRAGVAAAATVPLTLAKSVLPAVLAVLALAAALRVARAAAAGWRLWAVPAAAMLLLVAGLFQEPTAMWSDKASGNGTILTCLTAIPLIALLPLVALIAALRRGAAPFPARAGALAGMAAGGIAAAVYSLHCPEDSPLFYVPWYGLAILCVTAAGALAGSRFLRW
jgi:hypothetical protein